MEIVQSKDLKQLRVARGGDMVYKDECAYCFNSPVSSDLSESTGLEHVIVTVFVVL